MTIKPGKILAAALATALLASCGQDAKQPAEPAVEAQAAVHEPAAATAEIIADPTLPPLPIEELGHVERLPSEYPESWMLIDEAAFFNMASGKMIIVDVAEPNHPKRIKGMMSKSLLGNFTQSGPRGEFYIIESFHERGWRGRKYDILAIYDKQTLTIKKEIEWPTDRLQALPERYSMAVSDDQKFLYVANFNPAASFGVVDLDSQALVATISTPGCVLTYPTGKHSVTSICSNGGLLTSVLNADGTLKEQQRIAPFFDTDSSAVFEHMTLIDGIAYFPGFHGEIHSFDFSGDVARYLETWDSLSDEDKAGNWRPAGLGLNDYDDQGHYYTIMQPDGAEGTQTHGGSQVWVYDLKNKKRLRVIDTPNWAISIGVSRGDNPKLVVTNGELALDVFDAISGELIQTVGDFGNSTPLMIHKAL